MNNYLLESNDFLSISKKISEIIKKNNFDSIDMDNFDMNDSLLDNALEDLDTYGLFSSKKIVVINNFDKLKYDDYKDSISHLIKYVKEPNPDNLLIIVGSKFDDRKKVIKDLKKYLEFIKVEFDPINYIKNEFKGYDVENGVFLLINEFCRGDITKINNECMKIKNYKNDDKKVTKEDVNTLVVKKLGESSEVSFAFVRALAEKDKREALKKYNELLEYQFEPLSIIGLLESQFRIMYQVKILEGKRLSNVEIANILNEKSSYRIAKTKELTKYYSKEEILDMFVKLSDIDLKIKTTSIDSTFLLQLLILNM